MAETKPTSLILCVDDYEDILDGWRMLLESEGYQVLTAAEGKCAMQLFISQPVDEVVLDYQLPGITGDVIAREMKALKPNVPILLISGDWRLPEQLKPVDDFLMKGTPISVFLDRVRALLATARRAPNESLSPSCNDQLGGTDTPRSKNQAEAAGISDLQY